MFKNHPLVRIEILQREAFRAGFTLIWEGAENWCLFSITLLEHMPDIVLLDVLHIKILALAVELWIDWGWGRMK